MCVGMWEPDPGQTGGSAVQHRGQEKFCGFFKNILIRISEGRNMFYLTTHSTHFIYGYMASDIRVKDHTDRERGNCFRLTARVLLYASPQQTGLHIRRPLLYQSWSTGWNEKELNGSTPWRIDPMTHRTMNELFFHGATRIPEYN